MMKQNINIDFAGKIPPQAIDLEDAVLGALMLERDAFEKVSLKPQYFYKEINQKIFTAIFNLNNKGKEIDLMTVTEELKRMETLDEIGGPYYLSQLTANIASAAHIQVHSQVIFEKFVKRELIRVSSEIQAKAFDDSEDTFDLMDSFYCELDKINNEASELDEPKTFQELLKESLSNLQKRQQLSLEGKSIGIPTPVCKLTNWTCGWQPKQLIIIAGRPGMGKTAWALGCIKTATFYGIPTCMFSLEMSGVSLADRILVGESNVDANDYRSGKVNQYDWPKIEQSCAKISDLPIMIDDRPKSINKIRSLIKTLHRKGLCELAVIDYLQLSWDDNVKEKSIREQEVAAVTRKAKLIASELNIPVILLSQLNRQVELRQNKRPQLADLRESGAIEQDADIVIFIYRPEKYGILNDDETGEPLNGRCECILEKQREGQVGTIYFRYNKSLTQIYDYDEYNEVKPF